MLPGEKTRGDLSLDGPNQIVFERPSRHAIFVKKEKKIACIEFL
jgi:hypothetical protein